MRYAFALLGIALVSALALACTPSADQRPTIPPKALAALVEKGEAPLVLDVRTPLEFENGHVPGAVNIPHTELAARLAELGGPGQVVVYCETGGRAAKAEAVLREAGFSPVHLQGDMSAWRSGGFPQQK
jgi:phage shock protein E